MAIQVRDTAPMANGGWKILAVLGAAQFLMVLDQAVMNVSISQLVEDFDTQVTTIQAVITLYSLVMAALMIAGGKLGDLMGRRRAFGIGHVIYGAGSSRPSPGVCRC
jgi:MFS family permease